MTSATERSTRDGARRSCDHCGLPVPARLLVDGAELQFCCSGCRTVHALLHREGLTDYYGLRDAVPERPPKITGRSYDELETPAFSERHCREHPSGQRSVELYLEGVHCTACVWLVERLPRLLPGVTEARLTLGRQLAEVRWDPQRVSLATIARKLDRLGYAPHPYRDARRQALRLGEQRRLLVRIGVAGAIAGNVMLVSFALYAGMFDAMASEHRALFRWVSLGLATIAVLWPARTFFSGAWAGLRARALHMDLPIGIGILAGYLSGVANTVRGAGEIYFDSVTVLIFLLLVGRWLQQRQQRSVADATEMLYSLTPSHVRLLDSAGEPREVPLEAVSVGDRIEVLAGDVIPVDGEVVSGRSQVDEALLSGETRPLAVAAGTRVHAGTLNLGARLVLVVAAAGEQTRVGRLMTEIERHARSRAPIVRLADRIAGAFVATTLALALLTAALWWRAGIGAGLALEHAVALLIVTCPCALGLATPLAVSIAIGRAARRGILVKGGDALERLARPALLVLDKTGTLTEGSVRLLELELVAPGANDGTRATLLAQVAALERESRHHLARALCAAASEGASPAPSAVTDVCETPGGGIDGRVDGCALAIGSIDFIAGRLRAPLPAAVIAHVERIADAGHTPVVIARDGVALALASFGDPLRADAHETLARLGEQGFSLAVLSGDHPRAVAALARQLDVSLVACAGGVSPEGKLEQIERWLQQGPVVMVGDGVNDAAAISAATAGIAVHGGAEASMRVADVYIGRPGLFWLAELTAGARATLAVIRRNLLFSLAYNLVGATLAVAGLLDPLVAAVLMPLSSITVLLSSTHARAFRALGAPTAGSPSTTPAASAASCSGPPAPRTLEV